MLDFVIFAATAIIGLLILLNYAMKDSENEVRFDVSVMAHRTLKPVSLYIIILSQHMKGKKKKKKKVLKKKKTV